MSVFDKKNIPAFIQYSFDKFAEMEHKTYKEKIKKTAPDKDQQVKIIEERYKRNAPKIGNVCAIMD